MKTNKIAIAASFALVAGVLAGCTATPEAPTATGSEVPREDVTLRINTGVPPTHHINQNIYLPWKEYVEDATDGQVTVELYDADTLGTLATALQDVSSGVYDLTATVPSYFPESGLLPTTIAGLAFATPGDVGDANAVISEYLGRVRDQVQLEGVTVVGAGVSTPYQIFSREPLESVADLRGLQIKVAGAVDAELVDAWGAIPVQLPVSETYVGLERGTVEAAALPPETVVSFKIPEVAPHMLRINGWASVLVSIISTQFLDSLSTDMRALFDDDLLPRLAELTATTYVTVDAANSTELESMLNDSGGSIADVTDAESQELREAGRAQWEEWIATADGLGYDGQAMVDIWFDLLASKGAPLPYQP